MNKEIAIFSIKTSVVHFLSYSLVGAIAYQLLTKQFYIGETPIFTIFLRSESNPDQWRHVMNWIFPGQILRGLLIGLALYAFLPVLKEMGKGRRITALAFLMYATTSLAAGASSPSNIEGLIYLRPELVGLKPFLLTQPEMIVYSIVFAIGVSLIVEGRFKLPRKKPFGDRHVAIG